MGYEAKLIDRLASTSASSGHVIYANSTFTLRPTASKQVDAEQVRQALLGAVPHGIGNAELCASEAERIKNEMDAILSGEAAANAQLQSALDAMKPKHDYYEYG